MKKLLGKLQVIADYLLEDEQIEMAADINEAVDSLQDKGVIKTTEIVEGVAKQIYLTIVETALERVVFSMSDILQIDVAEFEKIRSCIQSAIPYIEEADLILRSMTDDNTSEKTEEFKG